LRSRAPFAPSTAQIIPASLSHPFLFIPASLLHYHSSDRAPFSIRSIPLVFTTLGAPHCHQATVLSGNGGSPIRDDARAAGGALGRALANAPQLRICHTRSRKASMPSAPTADERSSQPLPRRGAMG
jgi:hypothetical protein